MNGSSVLMVLAATVLALGGCKELNQTFEEADHQLKESRHGGTPEPEPEPEPTRREELLEKKLLEDDGRKLPPGSPEARLKIEIKRRLACKDKECSKKALGRIRANAKVLAPGIPELFTQQPVAVRREAVRLAGLLNSVESIEPLGKLAVENEGSLRKEAIFALGEIKDPKVTVQLERLVMTGVKWHVRVHVCKALGQYGQADAVKIMTPLIRDEHPDVRAACARSLGKTKHISAVAPLKSLARDSNKSVLLAAKDALSKLPGDDAKKAMKAVEATLVTRP